jgi:hypothetical protein
MSPCEPKCGSVLDKKFPTPSNPGGKIMGAIAVHEFIALDGVFEDPS